MLLDRSGCPDLAGRLRRRRRLRRLQRLRTPHGCDRLVENARSKTTNHSLALSSCDVMLFNFTQTPKWWRNSDGGRKSKWKRKFNPPQTRILSLIMNHAKRLSALPFNAFRRGQQTACPSRFITHARALSTPSDSKPHEVLLRRNLPGVKVRSSATQRPPKFATQDEGHLKSAKEGQRETVSSSKTTQHGLFEQENPQSYTSKSPLEETESSTGSDLSSFDIFRSTAPPNSIITTCSDTGFVLSGNVPVNNSGVMIAGGEAFTWVPSLRVKGMLNSHSEDPKSKVQLELDKDSLGRWTIPEEGLSMLKVMWPKPELLLIGTGASYVPLCPQVKETISKLGIRIELCDTRNASAHYNLLATERGVNEVAALMVPMGFH